jgi:hypothetical protein
MAAAQLGGLAHPGQQRLAARRLGHRGRGRSRPSCDEDLLPDFNVKYVGALRCVRAPPIRS